MFGTYSIEALLHVTKDGTPSVRFNALSGFGWDEHTLRLFQATPHLHFSALPGNPLKSYRLGLKTTNVLIPSVSYKYIDVLEIKPGCITTPVTQIITTFDLIKVEYAVIRRWNYSVEITREILIA